MSLTVTRSALAILILATSAPVAFGATFCATSGSQLQSYLNTAASNNESDEIRIPVGTYTTTPGLNGYLFEYISFDSHDLLLSGGWSGGCGAPTNERDLTVLDGQDAHGVLRIDSREGSPEITVTGIGVKQGYRPAGTNGAPGLEVYVGTNAAPVITVDGMHVRDSVGMGTNGPVRVYVQGDGQVNLRNLLVRNNVMASGAAILVAQEGGNGSVRMNQSTVTANTRLDGGLGYAGVWVASWGSNSLYMFNNVLWGNANLAQPRDLDVDVDGFSVARNNHVGTVSGGFSIESGRSVGDPDWTVDQYGYPTPNIGSPLIESGYSAPNGGSGEIDVRGEARLAGLALDRGAVENQAPILNDRIFRDSME